MHYRLWDGGWYVLDEYDHPRFHTGSTTCHQVNREGKHCQNANLLRHRHWVVTGRGGIYSYEDDYAMRWCAICVRNQYAKNV